MRPKYVAAFRTYSWDRCVAALARRFFDACPHGRHVILADETSGSLGIENHEVISHTENMADLGLISYPHRHPLWHNVDYGLYYLRRALPDYDYYLSSESDLAVNVGVEPIVQAAADRQADLMTHTLSASTPDWYWHDNACAVFANPMRTLLCFTIFSSRALDGLVATRRLHGAAFGSGQLKAWPFCESFVPTVLTAAGMRIGTIDEFVDTSRLSFRPSYDVDDPLANQPGTLVHPVLAREKLIQQIVAESDPGDLLTPDSTLSRQLRHHALADYAESLCSTLLQQKRHAGYQTVIDALRAGSLGLPEARDAAYGKPALVSSVSPWSHTLDPQQEAAGANGPDLPDDYGFHTNEEDGPWWLVDLLRVHGIEAIAIVNRVTLTGRFVNFLIESSLDSALWSLRHVKLTVDPVSNDPASPHRIVFGQTFQARYIRIKLIGRGMLHLRRVEIFGQPEAAVPTSA